VKRDVENFAPTTVASKTTISLPAIVGTESYEDITLSQMRKTIARRLSDSKNTAPHFYLTMSIQMDKVMEARKSMNEFSPVKISVNDIIIKAVAAALAQKPQSQQQLAGR
jgi:pyruvate dehydrogenase E2 component (dihydrolipoamide acetyltransferase)